MSDGQVQTVDTSSPESEYVCVVCFRNIEIFSIGSCDHPFCHECSTRMRVLCKQNECPICRQSLSKVIFTNDNKPYRELEKHRSPYYNKTFRIAFMTNQIQQAYFDLLSHVCPKCDIHPFTKFEHLKDHVRKEHEHFYCDLCVDNLKIFTFERRCYNRQQLGIHRRVGDPDNTSHRGHPLCEYCDERYLDRDELFRHLRKEHFFCHFCDADGSNQFYSDYNALYSHFKEAHFVCEQCTEKFTGIFRTDIDLKAHIAHAHAKSLGKLQEKQTRTLQLEITLGPRNSRQMESGVNLRSRAEDPGPSTDDFETIPEPPVRQQSIDARDEQQFPSLLSTNATNANLAFQPLDIRNKFGNAGLARTKENFPALGGGGSGAAASSSSAKGSKAPSVSNILKKTPNPSNSSLVIHVSNRPKGDKVPNKKDFPSLPSSSKQAPPPAYLNNIAAKHRNLVDDYVSAASGAFQKINLVQKEEVKPESKITAPSLTKQDFPTLAKVTKSSPELPNIKTTPNGKKTTNTSSWANTTQLRKSLSKTNAKYGLDNNNKKDVANKMNGNTKPKEKKPKTNGPTPPGFDGPKPPPGFSSVSLNSIAKTANNLTFTSSMGDKFRIIPSYQFTPPENCGKRNQDLVKIFKSSMPTTEAMEEFRNNTQRFRNGFLNAGAYYEHCESVLKDKFHVVFPELLALLPDIGKQQELYLVYSQRLKQLQKKGITNKLKVCTVCKQVLLTTDYLVHMPIHENNNKAE